MAIGGLPPWEDLLPLYWEAVLRCLVSVADPESVSSFCKQILHISNTVRSSLSITNRSTLHLSYLLQRFTSLKSIDLSLFRGNPSAVLLQITQFPLPLDHLDLSNQTSLRTNGLSQIDVLGNRLLSDQSLVVLSVNCPSLREVRFRGCWLITGRGIASLIVNKFHLVSLALNDMKEEAIFCEDLVDSFHHARGLSSLDSSASIIWDGLLMSVAEANMPLTRLVLSRASGFSLDGTRKIMLKHQGIEDLDLVAVHFLTDSKMSVICEDFRSLTSVDVSHCSNLTMTTMKDDASETDIVVNSHVSTLSIPTNVNLTDECLKKIGRMCLNLWYLDVGDCLKINGDGILGVLKSYPETRYLRIHEVLQADDLKLKDKQLVAFISRCCHLKHLGLAHCVVENCKTLREINLRDYHNACDDFHFLYWMMSMRPSLRRIVPSCGLDSSKIQDFFLECHAPNFEHTTTPLL
ncbi:hypothetical protein BT93_H1358 [Corymbia citriodora subsp. variegata]|nr:hypothetical protein BT93_H1358 [Corymbia citriodora subsp. variegata]